MDILKTYKDILAFMSCTVDNDGYVKLKMNDKEQYVFIDGKRVVLPTKEHLSNPEDKIRFHPLAEIITRGESPVITQCKTMIVTLLNLRIGIIFQGLLNLIASIEYHKSMNPEQASLLIDVKEVDAKTVTNFTDLMMKSISGERDKSFINIYLNRGGRFNNKRHARVGITNFPLYNLLVKGDKKALGSIRVKDINAYIQIYRFVFPEIDDPEKYNYGSNSNVAPFLDALMKTSYLIASKLNDVLEMYGEFIDGKDDLIFKDDWVEDFDNLDVFLSEIRKIPVQAGNEGVSLDNAPKPAINQEQPSINNEPHQTLIPVRQPEVIPYRPQKPEIVETKNGLDWESVKRSNPVLNNQSMMPQMQGMYPPMPMQGMMPPMGMYPQQGGYNIPAYGNPYQQPVFQNSMPYNNRIDPYNRFFGN